ncbi:signal peptidase I [Clostridium sp. FP1]|uniref:signal peptidase I n=1 Tax=Clostridium sp. FP1 TaxID=2724076 RepID=UPI0013E9538B|nr:signal peptidase I [Clostridium sp. FP1]MBZ9634057.1 signal peptidase I [Clostridium sp. FP1]
MNLCISIFVLFLSYLLRGYFENVFHVIKIEGNSMFPTFSHGNIVIVKKRSNYKDGDIIVFKMKNLFLIKRIIITEGEIIELKKGFVYRNHNIIFEPYAYNQKTYGDKGIQIVKKNHVFVMGDNRNNSLDSRSNKVGQVKVEQIIGRVCFVRSHYFRKKFT